MRVNIKIISRCCYTTSGTTYCINYGIRDGGGTNDDRLVMSGTSEQFTTLKYGVYVVTTTTLNDADFLFLQYAGDLAWQ